MTTTSPKFIGFEIEFSNCFIGPGAALQSISAAEALISAHHRLQGTAHPGIEFDRRGFRGYVDHLHGEVSSPMCPSARDIVLCYRAVRGLVRDAKAAAEKEYGPLFVAFDNTNRHGNSWGSHINVLISRVAYDEWKRTAWKPLLSQWVPFIATSPGLLGAGKLGCEAGGGQPCVFQMSQRADFINQIAGLETVASKNLINSRDESLCDPGRYARLHIICFDTNQLEFTNFLKFGAAQILLALIEEQYPLPNLAIEDPLTTLASCSRDMRFKRTYKLADGRTMTALEIQYRLAEAARDGIESGTAASSVPDASLIVSLWLKTLDALARNGPDLVRQLDWRARLQIIEHATARRSTDPASPNASVRHAADIQFGEVGGVVEALEQTHAVDQLEDFHPGDYSRAPVIAARDRARATVLERFGSHVLDVDWGRVNLKSKDDETWCILLDDPLDSEHIVAIAQNASGLTECLQFLHATGSAKIVAPVAVAVATQPNCVAQTEEEVYEQGTTDTNDRNDNRAGSVR